MSDDPWIDAYREWRKKGGAHGYGSAIGFQAGYIQGHMDAVNEAAQLRHSQTVKDKDE